MNFLERFGSVLTLIYAFFIKERPLQVVSHLFRQSSDDLLGSLFSFYLSETFRNFWKVLEQFEKVAGKFEYNFKLSLNLS